VWVGPSVLSFAVGSGSHEGSRFAGDLALVARPTEYRGNAGWDKRVDIKRRFRMRDCASGLPANPPAPPA
jgi:hypothetical protein